MAVATAKDQKRELKAVTAKLDAARQMVATQDIELNTLRNELVAAQAAVHLKLGGLIEGLAAARDELGRVTSERDELKNRHERLTGKARQMEDTIRTACASLLRQVP